MSQKKCVVCEQPLDGNKKKFCSNKCSSKMSYESNKAVINPNTYYRQVMKYRYRKFKLIELRGNEGCVSCGYIKNISGLDFHHRDPNLKSFSLGARELSNRSWENILEEFEKCDILCANCHREEHNPELSFEKRYEYDELVDKPKQVYLCSDCDILVTRGADRCVECSHKFSQTTERPDIKFLISEVKDMGFSKVGEKYGVSDNSIRKWIKKAGFDPKNL